MSTGGELALIRLTNLAPAARASHPTSPPATLTTSLPAKNPWRMHLQAQLDKLQTRFGDHSDQRCTGAHYNPYILL
jgi:hypothetical protein